MNARRRVFDWHLAIGRFTALLILVWAFSGSMITLEPMLSEHFGPAFPKLKAPALDAAAFRVPPAAVLGSDFAALALRQFAGRSWYEATRADGSVAAFDARSGRPVDPLVPAAALRTELGRRLAGTAWTPGEPRLQLEHDDVHRKGRLPVYRVPMEGPGGVVAYFYARDGGVERVTTRVSRALRWLGLGLHTWNVQYVMKHHDDARVLALVFLVALPLIGTALAAYLLLYLRRKAAGKRALALALALLAGAQGPLQAAPRAVQAARGSSPAFGLPPLPARAGPLAVPDLPLASPVGLGSTVVEPAAAALVEGGVHRSPTHERAPSVVAEGVASVPASAGTDAREQPTAIRTAEEYMEASRQEEGAGADLPRRFFDAGARLDPAGAVEGSGAPAPASGLVPAGSSEGRPPAEPPAPVASGRESWSRGAWGVFITHAVNLVSLSLLWRIAWPDLAIDAVGKAGYATIGTFDALADLGMGLVAGVIVDRFLPARSMAVASLLRAAVGAFLALSFAPSLPLLIGLSMTHFFTLTTIYIGQAAVSPAAAGGDAHRLQRMNIVLKLITLGISIPASLAGGWLVARTGAHAALAAYAAVNVLLAALFHLLIPAAPAPSPAPAETAPKAADGVFRTMRAMLADKVLLAILAATMTASILAEPLRSTFLPIIAKDLLLGGPILLGNLLAVFYTGQLAGSLALWRWGKSVPPIVWVRLAALGFGAFWLLTLVPASPVFLYAAVGLIALLTQPAATVLKTLFQNEVAARHPELLGRAMGVHLVLYSLAVVAETAWVGWLLTLKASFSLIAQALAATYTALAAAVLFASRLMRSSARPAAPRRPGGSAASGSAPLALFAAGLGTAAQWHLALGVVFGAVILWYAWTGTASLLRPWILSKTDPALPPQPKADADPSAFTVTPAAAAAALPAGARAVSVRLRWVPGSPRKAWYELQGEDGRLYGVTARRGRLFPAVRSRSYIRNHVRRWLEESPWSIDGEPELLTREGEYYRKGEVPHYRVRLKGPGSPHLFLSAYDGSLLASHSRHSRALKWAGKGLHAWGVSALDRFDTLKRLLVPLALGLPMAALALTAFWMRVRSGFHLEFPGLSGSAYEWHRFLGSFTLFTLLVMAVTGPATLLITVIHKHLSPELPRRAVLGAEAFRLSPEQAARALDGRVVTMRARASATRAYYEFTLEDGRSVGVSAVDGSLLPAALDAETVRREVEAWFVGSRWKVKGDPVLVTELDRSQSAASGVYSQGPLPAYRVDLEGPWGLRLYLSAKDASLGNPLIERTRAERWMLRWVMGVHTLEAFPLGERLRKALLFGLVVLPIAATVVFAYLRRLGF